jgi:hypothetical protein
MIDVVMLSYRTCLSKDCLLILIVRVVLGDLIVLDVLGLAGCGVYIPWGPWVLGPRTLEPRAPEPKGPWAPGSLGPRVPGSQGPWALDPDVNAEEAPLHVCISNTTLTFENLRFAELLIGLPTQGARERLSN